MVPLKIQDSDKSFKEKVGEWEPILIVSCANYTCAI